MANKTKEQEELERKQAEEDRRQSEAAQRRADDETAASLRASPHGVSLAGQRPPTDQEAREAAEADARIKLANRASGAETKPVGITIRGGKPGPDGKHYGGELVTHDETKGGVKVLATFTDKQVNTGNPEDGTKPR